jgi:hypothetical protein
MDRLADIQHDTRQIKQEYNIPTSGICVMARGAEESISDTALRSTFLRLLIDLHEFGREAKRRGLFPDPRTQVAAGDVDPVALDAPLEKVRPIDAALGGVSQRYYNGNKRDCPTTR